MRELANGYFGGQQTVVDQARGTLELTDTLTDNLVRGLPGGTAQPDSTLAATNTDGLTAGLANGAEVGYTGNDTVRQSVVFLPQNDSQIKHIFTNKDGHLPDTPENRQLIFDLANNSSKFVGIDAYGTSWHAVINADGTQTWVRYYNKTRIISDAGQNQKPFAWNDRTGFNIEPKQWRKNHE